MRVLIVGGGPAGLYFAGLFGRSFPEHDVTVVEQTPAGMTYGFGVVFSDTALNHLATDDPVLYATISASLEKWQDLTVVHRDERVSIDGNGFSGISRLALLRLLEERACACGVTVRHGLRADPNDFSSYDLVVGADGVNSVVAGSGPFDRQIDWLTNRFIWYGTAKIFDTLSLTFRTNFHGHFVAHHYRYSQEMSTFIIECDAMTFNRIGFAAFSDGQNRAYCEALFAADLNGHALISNRSEWRRFPIMRAKRWYAGNTVLIGDALRSVHFSIGSGTRLALEDALALWRACMRHPDDLLAALAAFEASRRPIVEKFLAAAAGSSFWYEDIARRMALDPIELAYDYMTRSGRVDRNRLRRIAPRFAARYDARRQV